MNETLCRQCQTRAAARGRTRCWHCIRPYQRKAETDKHAPGWDKVPIGTRFTLSEIAQITGLKRESIAVYTRQSVQAAGKRKLPPGFRIVRTGHYEIYLVRDA